MTEEKRPISCKIVMIGNSGVGKTSLVNTWVNGQYTAKSSPTIGANHLRKIININDESLDICIWDTAGQEQYHSLAPLYTRAAAAAVAVASITDTESFEKLPMWLNLVAESCDEVPPIILAVSKNDLANESTMKQSDIEETYGDKFSGIFYTSALTGENVDSMFIQSAKLGLQFLQKKGQCPSVNVEKKNVESEKKGCC